MSDSQNSDFAAQRRRMVVEQLRARGIADERVLAAMERIPRHEFLDPGARAQAYDDCPLPIGAGQTISQPYIVALMLQALAPAPTDTVLEIGTGSGYVAALLSELAARVISIERVPTLAALADRTLRALGYHNVEVLTADGSLGLPEQAPFDAILVSAAAPAVPAPLVAQLADGGRLVAPLGGPVLQELTLIRKLGGETSVSVLEGCRFVPLVGVHGFHPQ
ncbi:MAG: protein-L-isoaspartate(D-aspartate) O-methyltransferase [Rhodospirillaceae bacterium]